jgi:hypothetical protein
MYKFIYFINLSMRAVLIGSNAIQYIYRNQFSCMCIKGPDDPINDRIITEPLAESPNLNSKVIRTKLYAQKFHPIRINRFIPKAKHCRTILTYKFFWWSKLYMNWAQARPTPLCNWTIILDSNLLTEDKSKILVQDFTRDDSPVYI